MLQSAAPGCSVLLCAWYHSSLHWDRAALGWQGTCGKQPWALGGGDGQQRGWQETGGLSPFWLG